MSPQVPPTWPLPSLTVASPLWRNEGWRAPPRAMKTLPIGVIAAASIAASAQAGPAPAVLSFKLPAQIVGKGDPVKGPQTYP